MQPSRGRLVLKGHGVIGGGVLDSASRKRAREDAPAGASAIAAARAAGATSSSSSASVSASVSEPKITRTPGTGTLRTSSTTVYGVGTRFDEDVCYGDVLEVGSEARPVAFVLSATSLGLSEAFSVDVAVPAPFTVARLVVVRDAASMDPAAVARAAASARLADVERQTGAGGRSIQVKSDRGKGTYSFVAAGTGSAASREEQLDARAKARGRDKFC